MWEQSQLFVPLFYSVITVGSWSVSEWSASAEMSQVFTWISFILIMISPLMFKTWFKPFCMLSFKKLCSTLNLSWVLVTFYSFKVSIGTCLDFQANLIALTKGQRSKRLFSKSFMVVIPPLSTHLIKPNFCFWSLPPTQHHSFFRN